MWFYVNVLSNSLNRNVGQDAVLFSGVRFYNSQNPRIEQLNLLTLI